MTASLSNIVAKDGTPTTIAGGILAVDKSGAGTGPFIPANVIVDTQGVNTATIKAATTAVASGDTALAVGLHPTSPLPAGTNVIGHVIVDTAPTTAVTGTFWQATQPVSLATNAPVIAAGTNVIGKVGINDGTTSAKVAPASTLPIATDPALIVTIRDVNANGSAVSASSAPVVIASDQAAITTQLAASANLVSGAITTAMTGTTTTSLVAAPGSSLRNYITTIVVSNSHATVGTDVVIQDGSGGTTLLTIPAAALYGGGVITLPVPLRQPTANTALFCANVTTGASTKVSAFGFKAA